MIHPYQLMEWTGVALIAFALSFVHIALSIGAVGLYLFASALIAQLTEGSDDQS